MGLRIYNNVEALNAHRTLQAKNLQIGRAMERLSSGLRINRAADDAAGRGQLHRRGGGRRVRRELRLPPVPQPFVGVIRRLEEAGQIVVMRGGDDDLVT